MSTQQPEVNELCKWFDEEDGFKQGTDAPHKWVLQANSEIHRLHDRVQELGAISQEAQEALEFVERWAVHHGTKPSITAEEALSCIQHYPTIRSITKSYADGKVPNTFDPFSRIAELESINQQLGEQYDTAADCVTKLQAELVKEASRTAEEKLRADQMTEQHRMQAAMNAEAREELSKSEKKPLTDKQRLELFEKHYSHDQPQGRFFDEISRMVELAHGITKEN